MKKTNKRIKNRIKILFIGVLMLAAAVIISAGDIIFKAGNLDVSNNLAVNTDALYVDSANKKFTLLFEIKTPAVNRSLKIEIRKEQIDFEWERKIAFSKYAHKQVMIKGLTLKTNAAYLPWKILSITLIGGMLASVIVSGYFMYVQASFKCLNKFFIF